MLWFPVMDLIIKLIKIDNREIFKNLYLSTLREIKIPIFGYYNWELLFVKK